MLPALPPFLSGGPSKPKFTLANSFVRNTCIHRCNCSFQSTYSFLNSFVCNTYKNRGSLLPPPVPFFLSLPPGDVAYFLCFHRTSALCLNRGTVSTFAFWF